MLFITGITGLTGRYLYEILIEKGVKEKNIRCMVRETSDYSWLVKAGVEVCFGDAYSRDDLSRCMKGATRVIHLVNIRCVPQVIEACKISGVRRVILISTTGIYSKFNAYGEQYRKLERELVESSLDYTIIRPTMIYGNKRDKNIHRLINVAKRTPIFPIIGTGANLFQPIYAKDLAQAIYNAVVRDISVNKAYDVSGKYPISYQEMLAEIYKNLDKSPIFLHVPFLLAQVAAKIGDAIPRLLVNSERVNRLKEDKDYDHSLAKAELDFNPLSFQEGVRNEIRSMNIKVETRLGDYNEKTNSSSV
ncbi:MAG: NAD(P)H-binding protein [Desulfosporosinus sp.]|nr:NAD(P)H-binding protein [Desulfosporosinus sp.]